MRDYFTSWVDEAAHSADSAVIDLAVAGLGPGREIRCELQTSSDLAACTGVEVLHGSTSSPTAQLIEVSDPSIAGKIITFTIPSNVLRYIQIKLVGTTSAGTWSCNPIIDAGQTNL